jgi:hypothetical protein
MKNVFAYFITINITQKYFHKTINYTNSRTEITEASKILPIYQVKIGTKQTKNSCKLAAKNPSK